MSTWFRISTVVLLSGMIGCADLMGTTSPPSPVAPVAPAPVPAAVPLAMPAQPVVLPGANGGAAGDAWCCQYDGPLGKTQALLASPAECASTFADHSPEFITAPECAPVCCKYASDPADLTKGYTWDTIAAGNCNMRKGAIEALAPGPTCRDPSKLHPKHRPKVPPKAEPEPEPEPTFRERLRNPLIPKKP